MVESSKDESENMGAKTGVKLRKVGEIAGKQRNEISRKRRGRDSPFRNPAPKDHHTNHRLDRRRNRPGPRHHLWRPRPQPVYHGLSSERDAEHVEPS